MASPFEWLTPFLCLTSLRASPFTFLWLTPFECLRRLNACGVSEASPFQV
jgi:hypothetical protein